MFYMELPLNASLPEGAVQFGKHDFPHSDVSPEYRKRKLPFVAVPRKDWENDRQWVKAVEARTDQLGARLEGRCTEQT
jgi:hypothetical protein